MVSAEEIESYILEKANFFLLPDSEIYSLNISGFADNFKVQLVIDKLGNVSESFNFQDLQTMSEKLSALLEEKSYSEYLSLELSTPGAERSLRNYSDYIRFQGSLIDLIYTEKDKTIQGIYILQSAENNVLKLKKYNRKEYLKEKRTAKGNNHKDTEGDTSFFSLDFDRVKKARLYIDV